MQKIIREAKAANTIAAAYRYYKAQGIMKVLRQLRWQKWNTTSVRLQCWARSLAATAFVEDRRRRYNAAAPQIQRIYRAYRGQVVFKRMVKEKLALERLQLESCCKIQNAWRSHKAKTVANVIRWKMWKEKRKKWAVLKTQSSFRRYRCRRMLLARKVTISLESLYEDRLARRSARVLQLVRRGAALVLQKWYRALLERRFTKQKIAWRKEEAAITIQKHARSAPCRTEYKIRRAAWLKAILQLQCWRRAKRAQRMMQALIDEAVQEYIKRETELQDNLEEYLMEEKKKLDVLDHRHDSAKKIQRMFRRYLLMTVADRADREYEESLEARKKMPTILLFLNSAAESAKANRARFKEKRELSLKLQSMTKKEQEEYLEKEKERKEKIKRENIARKARIERRKRERAAQMLIRQAEKSNRDARIKAKIRLDLAESEEFECERKEVEADKECAAAPLKLKEVEIQLSECKAKLLKAKGLEKRPLKVEMKRLEEELKLAKNHVKETKLQAKNARLALLRAKKHVVKMELEFELLDESTKNQLKKATELAVAVKSGETSPKSAKRTMVSMPTSSKKHISRASIEERFQERNEMKLRTMGLVDVETAVKNSIDEEFKEGMDEELKEDDIDDVNEIKFDGEEEEIKKQQRKRKKKKKKKSPKKKVKKLQKIETEEDSKEEEIIQGIKNESNSWTFGK
eukprot:g3049.t1